MVCSFLGVRRAVRRCPGGAGRWFLLVLVAGWRWCVAWLGWEGARAGVLPPDTDCSCDL